MTQTRQERLAQKLAEHKSSVEHAENRAFLVKLFDDENVSWHYDEDNSRLASCIFLQHNITFRVRNNSYLDHPHSFNEIRGFLILPNSDVDIAIQLQAGKFSSWFRVSITDFYSFLEKFINQYNSPYFLYHTHYFLLKVGGGKFFLFVQGEDDLEIRTFKTVSTLANGIF